MNGNILDKNQKTIFVLFLLLVFSVSLSYSFYFRVPPLVDARAYDTIAWNMVEGHGYRESQNTLLSEDYAIVRVGPGYEFFLSGIYFIFGHRHWVVWVFQALLLTLSAFFIFLITKEIFGDSWHPKIGLVAAALIGLSPDLVTIQSMLMSETFGIFLITLTIYLFFRYSNYKIKPSYLIILIGIFSGFAILVRTSLIFILFPILIYLATRKKWVHISIFLLVLLIIFAPWTIRNFNLYHVFLPFNAASGFNLLMGNHPGANGEQGAYSVLENYSKKFGYIEANQHATREAINFIVQNPLAFIKLTLLRISIYFSFSRPTGFWFHLSGISRIITLVASAIYSIIIFVFGFSGVWKGFSFDDEKTRMNTRFFLLMLIMMPLSVIALVVETRYRFFVYPFFAAFSGYFLSSFKIDKKKNLFLALTVFCIMAAISSFDILKNLPRVADKLSNL